VTAECSQNAETEPMTLQAVFFDMGGTIETFWYSSELRLRATPGLRQRLLSAGIDLPLQDAQLFDVVTAGLECYHQWSLQSLDELPAHRVWREFVFADYAVDPLRLQAAGEDLMLYIETRFYQRRMRPESPAVLESIRRMGLKIGLISNVCSRGQVPTCLDEYGLREYFNPVVLSSEYGRRKPDPSIFHYAARLAEVPTGACAYVGDRVARDIQGAQAAGYRLAIQIRHDFHHGEDDLGAVPDATIDSLTELIEILRAEQSASAPRRRSLRNPDLQVRALLFDAGDILYRRPDKGRCLAEFLTARGSGVNDVPAEVVRSLRDSAFRGELGQEQYRRALLGLYGVIDPAAVEQGMRVLEQDDQSVCIIEGVAETLASLKARGYLLGIITDTAVPVHAKLAWFAGAGFGHVWDCFISSRELGIQKPDARIYHAALRQLGLSPGQAAFVGHAPEELNGARAVGMYTIAFNYDKGAVADDYLERFPDLLDSTVLRIEAETDATPQE
jgi:FMN phosphatase YigB (HAD superfamily)